VERECARLSGSQGDLQRDVYELCELVLDIASSAASRPDQARRNPAAGGDAARRLPSRDTATKQFVVRFDYDPFAMSPNADPESELPLRAGEPVIVFGGVDSVRGGGISYRIVLASIVECYSYTHNNTN